MSRRGRLLIALLALTAIRFLIASPLVDPTALWASGRFIYPAQQWLRGVALYRDVWGHVPPLIYGIDALGWAIGGLWGLWLVELICLLGAVTVGYRLLASAFGGTAAFFGLACGLLGLSLLLQGNQLEEYALLLQFGTLYAFARAERHRKASAWSVLTGALIGLLFWLRPDLIGVGLAITAYLLVKSVRRSPDADTRLMTMLIGALVVVFVGVALLAIGGALAEAWNAVARYNLAVSVPLDDRFGMVLIGIQTLGRAGLPLVALAAWGVGLKTALTPNPSPGGRGEKITAKATAEAEARVPQYSARAILGVTLIALPIELILTLLDGGQTLNHVVPWLPSITILAAFLASILLASTNETKFDASESFSPRPEGEGESGSASFGRPKFERNENREEGVRVFVPPRVWLAALLIAFSLMPLVDAASAFQIARTQNFGANAIRLQAINDLRQRAQPDERLLVWGNEPMVNVLSGLPSPTRLFEQIPLFVPVDPAQAPFAALADDLATHPPAYILDTASGGDRVPPLDAQNRRIWQLNQRAGFLPAVSLTPEVQLVLDTAAQYYQPVARYGAWTLYARRDLETGTTSR